MPLGWIANPGTVGPWFYENDAWGWFRAWGGGHGRRPAGWITPSDRARTRLRHFNQPHIRTKQSYGLHGRVGRSAGPARRVRRALGRRRVRPVGRGRGAAVGGLRRAPRRSAGASRRGSARAGSRSTTRSRTSGTPDESHMFLYHCNVGFPVVDEGSSDCSSRAARPRPTTACRSRATRTMSGPDREASPRRCFEHELIAEPAGTVPVALVNRALGARGLPGRSGSTSWPTTPCGG